MNRHDADDVDDVDVDVCLSCGRYFGFTQFTAELWRNSRYRGKEQTMPQFCHRCIQQHYGDKP